MGTNYVMRNGLIAALGVSGLMLSACAGNHGSRYASIYDYESGGNCGSSCGAPAPAALPPVYTDCGQVPQMGCVGPAPAPAMHVAPAYSGTTTYNSPPSMSSSYGSSGTVSTGSFSSGSGSFSSGSGYSSGVMSSGSSYGSGTISSSAVECPSGTTLQPDNTCMQNSSSYSSGISAGSSMSSGSYTTSTTSSTYVPSTTVSSQPVTCPAGTILQADNTCMQTSGSSYSSHTSTVTTTAPATTTTHHGGYTSSGGYTATDYLPIRK